MKATSSWPIGAICVITLGFPCGAAVAQTAGVTIFGIVDAGVEVSNAGAGTRTRVTSGGMQADRWGLTGGEDLGGGMRASFRLESGFNIDDGTLGQGGRMFGREASVSLSSARLGTVSLGRNPTPYYLGTYNMDAFLYGHVGGLPAVFRTGSSSQLLLPLMITARNDNSVNYISPKLGGVEVRLQVAAGEGSAILGRGYGASARYFSGPWDVAVTFGQQDAAKGVGTGKARALSAGGSYDFGPAKIYAAYVDEKNDCTTCTGSLSRLSGVSGSAASEIRMLSLGVRAPITPSVVGIAQAVRVQDRSVYAANPGSRNSTLLAAGAEYSLSKRTVVYGSAGTVGNEHGSQYMLGNGGVPPIANSVGPGNPRAKVAAVGIRHTF